MKADIKKLLPEQIRRIMVFNAKGGVGKTALAVNLALTFGYGIITNDRISVVGRTLPKGHYRILKDNEELAFDEIPSEYPVIFDFGGYPDRRVKQALAVSRIIFVPVLPHDENIQDSLNLIKEIKDHVGSWSKIIVVINKTSKNQYQDFKGVFNERLPKVKTFNVKSSTAFSWMIYEKKSIECLSKENARGFGRHFKIVSDQFNDIAEYLYNISIPKQTHF